MTSEELRNVGNRPLSKMDKAELLNICDQMEIEYPNGATNAALRDAIRESGKWSSSAQVEMGGGSSIVEDKSGKKVRAHKTLGIYRKCIVHPTEASQQNTSIFVSIGMYVAEFHPKEEVSLPETVIDFLKKSTAVDHVYDHTVQDSTGRLGAHIAKQVPKYIVEVL